MNIDPLDMETHSISLRVRKFFTAAAEGKLGKIRKYHRIYKMDIFITDEDGNSLLHHAAYGGHKDIITYLIENGVNQNFENYRRETPLHAACAKGHYDATLELCRLGANPNFPDENGETSIHYACRRASLRVMSALLSSLYYPPDFNARNIEQYTPLMLAVRYSNLELTNFLLSRGANISHSNNNGNTALHIACLHSTKEVVAALLTAGATFTITTNGNSPLHASCMKGNLEIVQLLLQHNIDHNIRNINGKTACDVAKEGNHQRIVEILEQLPPPPNPTINPIPPAINPPPNSDRILELTRELENYRRVIEEKNQALAISEASRIAIETEMRNEIERKDLEIFRLRNQQVVAPAPVHVPQNSQEISELRRQLSESLSREQGLRESLNTRYPIGESDYRTKLALLQAAEDCGLDIDAFMDLQLIRRNINTRTKHHRYLQFQQEINSETDFTTLRQLGLQLRALKFDPTKDLRDSLPLNEIQGRSDALLAVMDRRWRDLLTLSENEEASEKCQITKREFQGMMVEWEKTQIEDGFIRRLEELNIRFTSRSNNNNNPQQRQSIIEEINSLIIEVERITSDMKPRYQTRLEEMRRVLQTETTL